MELLFGNFENILERFAYMYVYHILRVSEENKFPIGRSWHKRLVQFPRMLVLVAGRKHWGPTAQPSTINLYV